MFGKLLNAFAWRSVRYFGSLVGQQNMRTGERRVVLDQGLVSFYGRDMQKGYATEAKKWLQHKE